MALLEVTGLHVEIDGREILRGLDLAVDPGEVHAIMGPNGSGKVDILALALLKGQEFFT
jgi:Fe-S cluster assembly ATP-binding protein